MPRAQDVQRLLAQLADARAGAEATPVAPFNPIPIGNAPLPRRPVVGALDRARAVGATRGAQWGLPPGATPGTMATSPSATSFGGRGFTTVPRPWGLPADVLGVNPAANQFAQPITMSSPASLGGGGATLAQAEVASPAGLFPRAAQGVAPGAFDSPGFARGGAGRMAAQSSHGLAVPGGSAVARVPSTALAIPEGSGLATIGQGGSAVARAPLGGAARIPATYARSASLGAQLGPAAAQQAAMSGAGGGAGAGPVGGGVVPPVVPPTPGSIPFGGAGWFKQGLGRVGGTKALLGRGATAAGAGYAANWLANKATGDEWDGSADDAIESAAGWGTAGAVAGATIGAPFFGIGAVPGAAIGAGIGVAAGGLHGWLTGNDSAATQAQQTNDKLSGKLDALVADYGLSPDMQQMLDSQLSAALFAAETPEEIKAAYAQGAAMLPQLVQQDAMLKEQARVDVETTKERNARAAAVQAYIMPMLRENMGIAQRSAAESGAVMGRAAMTVSDPQLRAIYEAQAARVPAESARQNVNTTRQAMLMQQAYQSQFDSEQEAYRQQIAAANAQGTAQPGAPQFDERTLELIGQLGL